ncbi:hypothetical protein [Terasakiella pusilla]|uniref:hypothetical protein n=1 Tax=Terasakiella pusilla TaxID=64973 RepID=UPI003AA96D28
MKYGIYIFFFMILMMPAEVLAEPSLRVEGDRVFLSREINTHLVDPFGKLPRSIKYLHLKSEGGTVQGAMFLAMQIRERKLTNIVKDFCHMFQSGVHRIIHPDATMTYQTTTNPEVDEPFGNILVRYGLNRQFYDQVLNKPGVNFTLMASQLLNVNAATEMAQSDQRSSGGYLAKRFSHDNMTRQDWEDRRDNAAGTRKAVGECHQHEMRVHDARDEAGGYLGHLGVNRGGYIPYAVVMREQRRMQELAYIAYDKIKEIKFGIREWNDPVAMCAKAADVAIEKIRLIQNKFPPLNSQ